MAMEINLSEVPKGVKIIQGFPGFGMVGSISTEFLIQHLKTREIGTVKFTNIAPIIAIHSGKVVPPVGIYYDPENNIVILNFLTKGNDHEWEFANLVTDLAKQFEAKEIIAIEGVTSQLGDGKQEVYAYSREESQRKKLETEGFTILNEGIIMGVSAALLMDKSPCNLSAFFSLTASTLPDSSAAAEIIKALDKYMGLKVDYTPLYAQAKLFEEKIKSILSQSQKAIGEKEKSMINYVS